MTTIDEAQKRVAKFMIAGGQLPERLERFRLPDLGTMARRVRLLEEELGELSDAWKDGDGAGLADAYADLLYVLLGGAEEAGFDLDIVFAIVADANDEKIDWKKGEPFATREDGKILKPEGWEAPEPKIREALMLNDWN